MVTHFFTVSTSPKQVLSFTAENVSHWCTTQKLVLLGRQCNNWFTLVYYKETGSH